MQAYAINVITGIGGSTEEEVILIPRIVLGELVWKNGDKNRNQHNLRQTDEYYPKKVSELP